MIQNTPTFAQKSQPSPGEKSIVDMAKKSVQDARKAERLQENDLKNKKQNSILSKNKNHHNTDDSYLKILQRGYVQITGNDNNWIKSKERLRANQRIIIHFFNGTVEAKILEFK